MAAIAIVGAGLSGLTAAVALRRRHHSVTVFEAGDRVGGVVQSVRQGGFLADLGPNSMLAPPPLVQALIKELGLKSERVDAHRDARKRYVVRRGIPQPIPGSPLSLLTTSLFSPSAKLRILTEPFRRRRGHGEESLGELVRRRLGQELVDYVLNPMVAGIYAGDPDQLSAAYAMPSLGALETRYGSLVRGAIRMMKERRSAPGEPEGRLFSFRDGMAAIPLALAGTLRREELQLNTRVVRLTAIGRSWLVSIDGPAGATRQLFDAVIWTAPAHVTPKVAFEANDPDQWRQLGRIRYSPVAVTVSGYTRPDVPHPLDGFGMLVPAVERRQTLGTLFSSTLFPERAPDGYVTLTTFTGGARQPEIALADEARVHQAVDTDLRDLLGISAAPVFRLTAQYPEAIPQYNIGHGNQLQLIEQLERRNPGLYFAGSYRSGVAVAEVMTSGALAAEAVAVAMGPAGVAMAGDPR